MNDPRMGCGAGPSHRRRLILLGSTGSIGVNCLNVIEHLQSSRLCDFDLIGLAAGSNGALLSEQAARFGVPHVAIADASQTKHLSRISKVFSGADSALELVNAIAQPGDLVVGAMVGSAGLPATLAAIERGCDIALANKETLVAAGALVMPKVKSKGIHLLPIDSEHSAIFQCLETSKHQNVKTSKPPESNSSPDFDVFTFERFDVSAIKRIVITASGGPFRAWSKQQIDTATVDEALNHPTWSMGPKVTIDSASLMNKALEIIEAHWLFDLPADKIDVIVHPQSLIHSFVEFADNSVIAQLSSPDMKTPIQYALTWPQRLDGCSRTVDWTTLKRMDFEPVDHERFGAVKLAYEVINRGGTAGAIFNAANEIAVRAFLDHQIPFGRITELVREAVDSIPATAVHTLEDVTRADIAARMYVEKRMTPSSPKKARPALVANRQS